jgi:hypothetical protein
MTTVNVTHVKGCAEDLELGEGTVQQIRNGRIVSLTKLGASSIPWSQDPATGMLISIREYLENIEAELLADVAEAKHWADQAAIVINGVIDDNSNSIDRTWSSSKLSAALDALTDEDSKLSIALNTLIGESGTLSAALNALTYKSNALSAILAGLIDDNSASSDKTWSSGKLSAALAAKADKDVIFSANSQTVTESFTIQTGQNALSIGPTLNFVPSAVVTVETGASWTVI